MTGGASTPNSFSRWLLGRLSRETTSGRFIPEMDGLRFVAIAMVVLFHLNGYLTAKAVAALFPHLIASRCYMHNLIDARPSPALGVAWSLEIEVQFYILVPVLTLFFAVKRRWLRRCLLLAVMAGSLAAQTLYLPDHPRLALSILAYLQYFLAGFLLADIFLVEWKHSPRLSM